MRNSAILTAIICLLILAGSVRSSATSPANIAKQWMGMFFTGDDGTARAVTPSDPAPVALKGATSVEVSSWVVGPTPASWTMTASATDIALWNLGTTTVWVDFNSGGATVSQGIPLTASSTISRDACLGVVVWAVSSAAQNLTRAEGRR